jgi:hypothetical protein
MTLSRKLRAMLELFDAFPDTAVSPTKMTATVLGLSERTVRYHPALPRKQISPARYGQLVGDVRKLIRDGMPAQKAAA